MIQRLIIISTFSLLISFLGFNQITFLNLSGLTNASPLVGVPIGASGYTFDASLTNTCSNPSPHADANGNFSFRYATSSLTCEQCLTINLSIAGNMHITDNAVGGHGILEFADSMTFSTNTYFLTDPSSLITWGPSGLPGLTSFITSTNISAYTTWNIETVTNTIRICGTRRHNALFANLKTPIRIGVVTGTLPIELTHFDVENDLNHTAKVYWQTASESENDYFEVERSTDLENWRIIDQIPGAGTTSEVQNYQIIDDSPLNGTSYYRLKQVDFNGKFSYSESKTLIMDSYELAQIDLFPNPAKNVIHAKGNPDELAILEIFDLMGRSLTSSVDIQFKSKSERDINISNLPNGAYMIRTKSGMYPFHKVP